MCYHHGNNQSHLVSCLLHVLWSALRLVVGQLEQHLVLVPLPARLQLLATLLALLESEKR